MNNKNLIHDDCLMISFQGVQPLEGEQPGNREERFPQSTAALSARVPTQPAVTGATANPAANQRKPHQEVWNPLPHLCYPGR